MTTFLPMSYVINRMKIEDDLERLRREDPEAAARHCTDTAPRQS